MVLIFVDRINANQQLNPLLHLMTTRQVLIEIDINSGSQSVKSL